MQKIVSALLILFAPVFAPYVFSATPQEILSKNARAIVYLEVEDAKGGVIERGTGFIVSRDGYIVTAAHIKADPTQKLWAVIGALQGTRYTLTLRESDENADVALWQLPQSPACRHAVTISKTPVRVFDRVMALGFPKREGLSPSTVTIKNLTSYRGFYKTDGYLEPGNSGGPVFNEAGEVIAIVQGGTMPGTENNDIVPIALAVNLLQKRGVNAGIGAPVPFDSSCYATCRDRSHGIERWETQKPWGPVNSGWLDGGHDQTNECKKLIAGALAGDPEATITLLPGKEGMWEESKKDIFGHVEYRYFCMGIYYSGPRYKEKQSPACGLWD